MSINDKVILVLAPEDIVAYYIELLTQRGVARRLILTPSSIEEAKRIVGEITVDVALITANSAQSPTFELAQMISDTGQKTGIIIMAARFDDDMLNRINSLSNSYGFRKGESQRKLFAQILASLG